MYSYYCRKFLHFSKWNQVLLQTLYFSNIYLNIINFPCKKTRMVLQNMTNLAMMNLMYLKSWSHWAYLKWKQQMQNQWKKINFKLIIAQCQNWILQLVQVMSSRIPLNFLGRLHTLNYLRIRLYFWWITHSIVLKLILFRILKVKGLAQINLQIVKGIIHNVIRVNYFDLFNPIFRICTRNSIEINHFLISKYLIFRQNSLNCLCFQPILIICKFFIKKAKEIALKFSFIFIKFLKLIFSKIRGFGVLGFWGFGGVW